MQMSRLGPYLRLKALPSQSNSLNLKPNGLQHNSIPSQRSKSSKDKPKAQGWLMHALQ